MKSTLNNIGTLTEELPVSDHVSPNEYIVQGQDSIFDQKENANIPLSSSDVEFNSAGIVAEVDTSAGHFNDSLISKAVVLEKG
jgi:hypothetical protein